VRREPCFGRDGESSAKSNCHGVKRGAMYRDADEIYMRLILNEKYVNFTASCNGLKRGL
jgi:hypothetical protein